ncbi:hypothetical protein E4J89_15775 [Arthrobacter sp. CAU 1506]|uniref:hypothetical protein n=1 Tax=Arthrobacter sp. CAU 1506 TaxID=2560052 RepID=UPI0010ABBCFF|nr:hypothetical protein [Arthrobacter sp. CAU 1506]TJY67340.1 hypothetical protein E4J89_15775 [Arthrobacter sp. CAU 1506]
MKKSTKYRRMGKGTVSNVLRREIRAARLKVILDQELGRPTSDEVKLLAAMDLPRIVRRNYQGDDSADRRTCDSTNEDAAAGTSRREILVARLKVSMNELLGRDTPSKAMRQSRMKLAPIVRRHQGADEVALCKTGGPTNKEQVFDSCPARAREPGARSHGQGSGPPTLPRGETAAPDEVAADRQVEREGPDVTYRRNYDPTNREEVASVLRKEIRAARLKITLDKKLGRETSPHVKLLAGMTLPPLVRGNRRSGTAQNGASGQAGAPG